jgi:FkbM family methyltransferase
VTLLSELRAQLTYQRKLTSLLGRRNAIRFRAAMIAARLGLSRRTTITLHPKTLLHPVELRLASTDAEVYGQVIIAEEYAPIITKGARTIVDCGANIGLTSAYFLSRLPKARIIAIEPFAANAALCRRNLAPYGDRARVIEAAIWNRPTTLVLDTAGGAEWAVRVRPAAPNESGDIQAIDIPSLGLPHIDILKIDIEGSEEDLFSETEQSWLPTISSIAIELHGPTKQARFFAALKSYRYDLTHSGELTLCRNLLNIPALPTHKTN